MIWATDQIPTLLAEVERLGSVRLPLDSAREAQLFRFAIYNYRRRTGHGSNISIQVVDNELKLTFHRIGEKINGVLQRQ
jgi:hypothetical protein